MDQTPEVKVKLLAPKEIIRTTLGKFLMDKNAYNHTGIYVIACYPKIGCLYVGKSLYVAGRVHNHLQFSESDSQEMLRVFLADNFCDALQFRLDILVAPDFEDAEDEVPLAQWLYAAETSLIQHFTPHFNTQNN